MNIAISQRSLFRSIIACAVVLFLCAVWMFAARASADGSSAPAGSRLITVHDRDIDQSFVSRATTVQEALQGAGIEINNHDRVEPGLDEQLVADEYTVNIYRARPMVVVDGGVRHKVLTAARVPEQIAKDAQMTLYPEDVTEFRQSEDFLGSGAGLELRVTRAVPFSFTLYGETSEARTQATTVGEMLKEKKIELGENGRVSPGLDTPIQAGMSVRVWREGKQTITVDEEVAFTTEKIQDANREVGYKEVRTPGQKGARTVTYEVVVQDGAEVARTEIASITTKEAVKQVEIVGAKFNYTGGPLSEAQITALGMCESGMTATRNSGNGYYGAFQFSAATWRSYNKTYAYAHEAPLDVQKQAVQDLLSRSSIFSQFPGCAKQMRAKGII